MLLGATLFSLVFADFGMLPRSLHISLQSLKCREPIYASFLRVDGKSTGSGYLGELSWNLSSAVYLLGIAGQSTQPL